MTLRPIITLPDEKTLREVSKPVTAVDPSVRNLWDDMLETMYRAPGIGLAAIQIGVPRRLVVLKSSGRARPRATTRKAACRSRITTRW